MMKLMFFILATLLILPTLAMAECMTPDPNRFDNLKVNLTENITISFNLTNNCSFRVEDINMTSSYLKKFTPTGKFLEPNESWNFNATLQIIDNIVNITEGTILNDTIKIYGNIVYSEANISMQVNIANIPLTLNVSVGEVAKQYFYKKCLIEENQEYCTAFNISDVSPIVMVNQTNITYNVLLPLNTTKEFFDSYNQSLSEMLKRFEESKTDIKNASQQIIEAQERESNIFRNAFTLENYLKNPSNPAWIQISPFNVLRNTTGFSDVELTDALNVLFQTNKISQKTKKETLSVPVSGGVMTQAIDKVYIASTERLQRETTEKQSSNMVITSFLVVIITLAVVMFYELLWKKRVKM